MANYDDIFNASAQKGTEDKAKAWLHEHGMSPYLAG